MNNSDIFNEYAKIALDKGLISAAKDDAKKILEKTRRADSQSISDISALYGVKPEQIDSQQYERNIAEVAHQNASVISPSYDKLNGTVWDANKKQNIALNIVNKPVNGLLMHHKYAQQELLKSLIRTANHMDNIEKDDLRVLADHCIEGLTKEAVDWSDLWDSAKGFITEDVKDVGTGALIGGAVGGLVAFFFPPGFAVSIGAGAVLGAAISGIFSTGPEAKNVAANSQETYDQIEKLKSDFPQDQFLIDYSKRLLILKNLAEKYETIIGKAQLEHSKIQGSSEKHTLSMEDHDQSADITERYIKNLNSIKIIITDFIFNVNRNKYESESSTIMNRFKKILVPFKALFGGTVHDALRASQALERIVDEAIKNINKASSQAAAAAASSTNEDADHHAGKSTDDQARSLNVPDLDGDLDKIRNG